MKFIHVSDLHLGKYLYGYSMIDQKDQPYWIKQFEKLIDNEKPDAIVIAGDVYDRSIAPREAIKLFGDFVTSLSGKNISVLVIAGNHDSGIRLASMSHLLKKNNVHIVGEVTKEIEHVTLQDEYGDVTFWLVPYLFPAEVERVLEIKGIKDYTEAMKSLLNEQSIDFSKRNVIVSHQTVHYSGKEPEKGGSEEMIGGISGIDQSVYDGFDYVALGHIHAAQKLGKETIRYSGSPLCYHFDETKKPNKGPIIIEMKEKDNISIRTEYIDPLHPLREITGTLEEIIEQEKNNTKENEYIKIVLTDDYVPAGVRDTLASLFNPKNSIVMSTEHKPSRLFKQDISSASSLENVTLEESFIDFYKEKANGEYPSEDEQKIIQMICEQIKNSDKEDKPDKPSNEDIDCILEFVYGLGE